MPTLELTLPRPHSAQQEIIAGAARFNVVCCGRRFGKSILGENRALEPALRGLPVAWFAPDYRALLDVWRDLTRILGDGLIRRKSEQEKRLELITGGVLEFWALDADPECSRGRKYARAVIDEAAKVRHLMRAWAEAIRANLTDYAGDAWFLSTPKGRGDFWEMFERGRPGSGLFRPEWRSWQMPTERNPHLSPAEIRALREEVGPRLAAQEVDAQFLEVSGRYFDEYEVSDPGGVSAHEIWSFRLPSHWHTEGGFDWGKAAPCAFGLNATDERGNVVIADEFYEAGLSNDEQATGILRVIERNDLEPSQVVIYADPSIFPPKDPTKRVGRYTVEDFWRRGLRMVPANNDRVNGWTRVREYLRHRDPHSGQAGLRIFKDKCPNLCRTIPLMVADERNPEDLDTTLEDHAVDGELRYGIQRPLATTARPSVPMPTIQVRDASGELIDIHPARPGAAMGWPLQSNRGRGESYE